MAVADDELPWEENAITVGDGAIQILPGPGPAVATIAAGVATLWGFTLNGNPVLLAANSDGSLTQIAVPGGAATVVAPAGTVTAGAHLTIWQGTPVLIIDPLNGYFSWDGTVFTTISAGVVGSAIAVFQGRVWISKNRTTQYTAPNTFSDFTAANGAGSFVITDDAFPGNIIALASALEELWIVGQSAIEIGRAHV